MQHIKFNLNFTKTSLLVLVFFVLTLLHSMLTAKVSIAANQENISSSSSRVSVEVKDALSIAIDADNVSFSLTPTEDGTFGESSTKVKIETNADGYKLYLEDQDENNALSFQNGTPSLDNQFSSLASSVSLSSEADFPVNSWGYSLDQETFHGIPLSLTLIKNQETPIPEDEVTVYFAAKVNHKLLAGSYSDTVVFTVIPISAPLDTPVVERKSYNTFSFSSYSTAAVSYLVTVDSAERPSIDAPGWTTEPVDYVIDTTSPHTYYVWSRNLKGQVSLPGEISSFGVESITSSDYSTSILYEPKVTLISGEDWEGEGQIPEGSIVSGKSLDENGVNYILTGTPVYVKTISKKADYAISSTIISKNGESEEVENRFIFPLESSILISATLEPATFFNISELQQMTTAVCNSVPNPTVSASASARTKSEIDSNMSGSNTTRVPETVLEDIRDGKSYLVRKLADGNCWMVQNLELDLDNSVTLASDNTDISATRVTEAGTGKWRPENSTQTVSGSNYKWPQADNIARSYSPRDEVYIPSDIVNDRRGQCIDAENNNVADCTSLNSTQQYTNRIGNYYNWYAATAGSGTTEMVNEDAPDSICPKGWTLPIGNATTVSKTYKYLLSTTYNVLDGVASNAKDAKMLEFPLNFIRGGVYAWALGEPINRGAYGNYLSRSAANTSTDAYQMNFYSSTVNTALSLINKGYGVPIRCVSR